MVIVIFVFFLFYIKLIFEATVANGDYSDIAIDDLFFKKGNCGKFHRDISAKIFKLIEIWYLFIRLPKQLSDV